METKICSKCKEEKYKKEFHKGKRNKDGHAFWCKQCMIEYKAKYKKENFEKIKEQDISYRKNNREKIKERYRNNKEKYKATAKNWKKQNPEKIKKLNQKYREKHRCFITLRSAKQRCDNPNNDSYNKYGGRGIKCLITPDEIKFIWFRDKADSMIIPSIHRIDNDGDYSLENCEILEWEEHRRIHYAERRERYK